jgi:hypothetical protein
MDSKETLQNICDELGIKYYANTPEAELELLLKLKYLIQND